MVNFTILAGGFSTFISTYVFDSTANTLTLTKNTTTGENPSWIALHPQNSSVLYAVNEVQPVGAIQSFVVDATGGLTLVDTVSSGGSAPTFTNPLSTGEVSAMNFGSPNSSLIATVPGDPLRFLQDSPIIEFPVNGGKSNPHMSLEFNGEVFVPDLGADKIWRLVNDGAPGKFKVHGQIDFAPGNGPRHIAIRDGILFTIHELTSVLTAQQIPPAPNGTALPLIANVSIVPPDVNFDGSFFAAEILISEPSEKFPDPLIYVSNRNLGPEFDPRGDTIAIFELTLDALPGGETDSPSAPTAPGDTTNPGQEDDLPFNILPFPEPVVRRAHQRRGRIHARQFSDIALPISGAVPILPAILIDPLAPLTGSPIVADPAAAPGTPAPGTPAPVNPNDPAVVGVRTGSLQPVAQVFTGLRQIRSMAIGRVADGGDEFLIAGANLDGGVAVLQRTDGGRNMTVVARNLDLPNRSAFVFL